MPIRVWVVEFNLWHYKEGMQTHFNFYISINTCNNYGLKYHLKSETIFDGGIPLDPQEWFQCLS